MGRASRPCSRATVNNADALHPPTTCHMQKEGGERRGLTDSGAENELRRELKGEHETRQENI